MEYKDYYQILGVKRDATQDAIKQAFRRLARKYHPDVCRDKDAEARFKDINEAYEVLKDPEKRGAYDQFGANWQNRSQAGPQTGQSGSYEFHASASSGQDFSEFFESLFGQSAAHGAFTGMGSEGNAQDFAMRGKDQRVLVTITLEEAFHGARQALHLNRPVADAAGHLSMQPQQLKVAIPKGIVEGQRIRLEGQGLPGLGGGEPGDLYLEIRFAPHPFFRADKRTIHLELPITPWEAALGATMTVPTLDGKVQLKIPANSQNGRKLRLKGKGLSTAKTEGDQIVMLKVVLPEAHTREQQEIYRSMAEKMAFNPRADLGV